MSGLPTSWADIELSVVAQVTSGIGFPNEYQGHTSGDLPFFKVSDISHAVLANRGELKTANHYVSHEVAEKLKGKPLAPGSTVFAKIGEAVRLNRRATVTTPCLIDNNVMAVKARDGVDDRYVHQFLRTIDFGESARSTTVPSLRKGDVEELRFPLAPAAEQKRIADKLDTVLTRVDAVNTRLARVAPLLKRFRQSVLAAATSGRLTEDWRTKNPGGNATAEIAAQVANRSKQEKKEIAIPNLEHWALQIPSEWTVASVHQFAECLDRLRVPIKKDQRDAAKGLYPYYGANGEVGRIDQFIFDDELVLVTEDETFYGREKPIAYRSSGKCWVNNHAHVLRCKSVAANDYLCFALMYYDVIPWLSGTTGRAKLTQQALLSLPIGVPPEAEQTEIVRRVETLFAFADRLEARLAQAQTAATRLTPALLAKAFRGELVPQDPNDEPAAELLRRLQAERATAPKASAGRGRKAAVRSEG